MTAIRVRDLHKSYGTQAAVRGVSLEIEEGEVYALLGHNGAGKSTLVEILEGHRVRDNGEVSVLGVDPARGGRVFRDRIGIVLQTSGVERELTVREAIELYGSAYRRRRPAEEVIALVGLDDKATARIDTLSGGQQRRLDLGLGIVGHPEVLFLDEPTTGFDVAARRKSWELIEDLCRLGTTVLLTTHYLDEAAHLADRVGVLSGGALVAEGTPADLTAGQGDTVVSFTVAGAEPGDMAGVLPGSSSWTG
ncbi:MAG TPA: ABC transporter ATP-binding protein, partial [Ilumatobacter sp.]|nr:ABC transporter ATP-binding protein [Ilumatobacter sp.]